MAKSTAKKRGSDKRSVPRRHLVFYLRVFDGMSNRVLGHLADVSGRGMMLVTDSEVEPNLEFRLRMRLPREIGGRSEIVLNAISRWCKSDTNPDFFLVGFQINELNDEYEQHIQQLIEDFSMENSESPDSEEPPACSLTHTHG
ncbi:MAG: PilZ domain-containing protein [Desulfobulbaceae bacterium]|nr:MAG: PilZ domain-containing protein [Desulfobulbaceae bacterium]